MEDLERVKMILDHITDALEDINPESSKVQLIRYMVEELNRPVKRTASGKLISNLQYGH